jgi:hypothetical protein
VLPMLLARISSRLGKACTAALGRRCPRLVAARPLSSISIPPSPSPSSPVKAKLKIKKQDIAPCSSSIFDDDPEDEDSSHDSAASSKAFDAEEESDLLTQRGREEKNKQAQQKAIFVTKAGAVANITLALSKGLVGLAVSSTALIADAANSLGDVLCDGVVYYTVQEARKTATPDSPWGRGKIESIGALSVGGLLMGTGIGIGYSAVLAGAEILNLNAVNPLQSVDLFSLIGITSGGDPTASTLHASTADVLSG